MAWGVLIAVVYFVLGEFHLYKNDHLNQSYNRQKLCCNLGSYFMLGLEIMIIFDIIHSVVSHTKQELIFLGVIVIIRISIGYFLSRDLHELHMKTTADK